MAVNRADWKGSISFAGFPIPIALHKTVAPRKSSSFKMLDPKLKRPVKQQLVDEKGNVVERGDTLRGVEFQPDLFAVLGPASLDYLERKARSSNVEVERFCMAETVPWELALDSYAVGPDDKVAGSVASIQTLWNGLHASGRAAIIENWTARSGARPSLLAIRAVDNGLRACVIPYAWEVRDVDLFGPVPDTAQAKMVAQVIEASYTTDSFDHSVYTDEYEADRQKAIDIAIGSIKPEDLPAETPAANVAVPDLMAALSAQVAKSKPAKKPPAKRAPRKTKAAA